MAVRDVALQLLGVSLFLFPLAAIQWDFTGRNANRRAFPSQPGGHRWRLELYSNHADIEKAMNDVANVPFAFKRVKSARGELGERHPERAWSLPRIELDLDVVDPFAEETLVGLFGSDYSVRFVSGDEAVIDPEHANRIRLRAIRHEPKR